MFMSKHWAFITNKFRVNDRKSLNSSNFREMSKINLFKLLFNQNFTKSGPLMMQIRLKDKKGQLTGQNSQYGPKYFVTEHQFCNFLAKKSP